MTHLREREGRWETVEVGNFPRGKEAQLQSAERVRCVVGDLLRVARRCRPLSVGRPRRRLPRPGDAQGRELILGTRTGGQQRTGPANVPPVAFGEAAATTCACRGNVHASAEHPQRHCQRRGVPGRRRRIGSTAVVLAQVVRQGPYRHRLQFRGRGGTCATLSHTGPGATSRTHLAGARLAAGRLEQPSRGAGAGPPHRRGGLWEGLLRRKQKVTGAGIWHSILRK